MAGKGEGKGGKGGGTGKAAGQGKAAAARADAQAGGAEAHGKGGNAKGAHDNRDRQGPDEVIVEGDVQPGTEEVAPGVEAEVVTTETDPAA